MKSSIHVEKCRAFINAQLCGAKPESDAAADTPARPAITISRQTGSGAHAVAELLAAYLEASDPVGHCVWTVFDKNLVHQVLDDHHLPSRLAQYMPENKVSEIDDAVGELLGLHPSHWTLIQHTTETILRLAKMGNVIVLGRGAHIIAAKLKNAFHVRLVGSLARRAEYVAESYHIGIKEALAFIEKEDSHRQRYLRKNFDKDIEDPLLYHLTVNTDVFSYEEAARIIGDTVLRRFCASRRGGGAGHSAPAEGASHTPQPSDSSHN